MAEGMDCMRSRQVTLLGDAGDRPRRSLKIGSKRIVQHVFLKHVLTGCQNTFCQKTFFGNFASKQAKSVLTIQSPRGSNTRFEGKWHSHASISRLGYQLIGYLGYI